MEVSLKIYVLKSLKYLKTNPKTYMNLKTNPKTYMNVKTEWYLIRIKSDIQNLKFGLFRIGYPTPNRCVIRLRTPLIERTSYHPHLHCAHHRWSLP